MSLSACAPFHSITAVLAVLFLSLSNMGICSLRSQVGANPSAIDYVTERVSPTSRPVLAMHLNPANCQCPPCVSVRTGQYNSHARNVYAVPLGGDAKSLSSAADSVQRLADDVGDWAGKGVANTQPVVALEGDAQQLKALQGRVAALAAELRQKADKARQGGSQQIGRGQ